MRLNNLFKDIDMALKNYLKRQEVEANLAVETSVVGQNLVFRLAHCGLDVFSQDVFTLTF